jgi:regulator of protease activity HflC (stomatin/prohibitin superfamily)
VADAEKSTLARALSAASLRPRFGALLLLLIVKLVRDLDIRFKRINYNESVRPKIYDLMVSERRQIAERFLSEGNGEAARIRGYRLRDMNKIQSEAYRQVEEIRGVADAKATEIYA